MTLAAGGAAVVLLADSPTVDDALRILDADPSFVSSEKGADSFADVADVLEAAGRTCDTPTCERLLEASAYARVVAVRVLDCTLPGLYDARAGMRSYVSQLRAGRATRPPSLPAC